MKVSVHQNIYTWWGSVSRYIFRVIDEENFWYHRCWILILVYIYIYYTIWVFLVYIHTSEIMLASIGKFNLLWVIFLFVMEPYFSPANVKYHYIIWPQRRIFMTMVFICISDGNWKWKLKEIKCAWYYFLLVWIKW